MTLRSNSSYIRCPQIDLDTIETSNLNRQFLFRKRHVGQSKAAVAAAFVRRFAPNATIEPHQVGAAAAASRTWRGTCKWHSD